MGRIVGLEFNDNDSDEIIVTEDVEPEVNTEKEGK